jgi:hypothetical protein
MRVEQAPFVFPMQLGSPSADDSVVAGAYFYAHRKCKITSVIIVNGLSVVADAEDYLQVYLKNGSNVVAEIDSRAAHENGLVADVAKAMNIVDAYSEVAAGSTLKVQYAETEEQIGDPAADSEVALLSNAVILISGYWIETE